MKNFRYFRKQNETKFTELNRCGKIGFLPNWHAHIRARVSGGNLYSTVLFYLEIPLKI